MAIHQPPTGARDLLPLDVAQKHWIETKLQDVFQRWGYQWIVTSTLERVETLMAGGSVQRDKVIQIYDSESEDLGLRPELTASIARAAVTRMAGVTHPQRLCYSANVFRKPPKGSASRQQEFFQSGVELLGIGGVAADVEVLLLLADCLERSGVTDWQLLLSEAGLTRSLLEPFPQPWRDRVRSAMARLDRLAIEAMPLEPALRDRALLLFDLRGRPTDIIQKVAQLDLSPEQGAMLDRLKTTVELLQDYANTTDRDLPIVLDLSLIQPFDYYTGIVFEAISNAATGHELLGQGGRYDQLLSLYDPDGNSYPGIGFCLNLEPLHRVLSESDRLPGQLPASDWLVVPASPRARAAAFVYAHRLRTEAPALIRVEIDLQPTVTLESARDRARMRRIRRLAWVHDDGSIDTEELRFKPQPQLQAQP